MGKKKKYIGHPDCLPADPSGTFNHMDYVYIDNYIHYDKMSNKKHILNGFFIFDSYDSKLDVFWVGTINGNFLAYPIPASEVYRIHPDDKIAIRFIRRSLNKQFDSYDHFRKTVTDLYLDLPESFRPDNWEDF